jgi:hypothetical protein
MFQKVVFFITLFATICIHSQTLVSNSTGSFVYTPTGPLSSKPIRIFYHIPSGNITTMPILMSFHGDERNANEYRDYWISMANTNKFMVFAPEFSDSNFPGGDAYNLANIFDDGDNPTLQSLNPSNEWTFSILDPLFEQIKTAVSGTQQKYNAWGHSAGAQFLHRFVMYMPNSKLDIAVCSNAGWYTVPESTIDFPYGTKNGQLTNTSLSAAFSKKLIVHLGLNDTNPNSPGLRHNDILDTQQGLNRLVRGRYFFTKSQSTAQTLSAAFNWEKVEVSGVDHNAQLMANNALAQVIRSTLSSNDFAINKTFTVFPNPTKSNLFFDNSVLKYTTLNIYSISGKLLKTEHFETFSSNEKIDVSSLASGIYFIKSGSSFAKIIKN